VTAPTRETFDEAITTSFGASTPPGGVSGEVVRVEEVTEQAVAAADLEGKNRVHHWPPDPEPITLFEAAGAEAVVYQSVNPDQLHEMIVTPVWGTPGWMTRRRSRTCQSSRSLTTSGTGSSTDVTRDRSRRP